MFRDLLRINISNSSVWGKTLHWLHLGRMGSWEITMKGFDSLILPCVVILWHDLQLLGGSLNLTEVRALHLWDEGFGARSLSLAACLYDSIPCSIWRGERLWRASPEPILFSEGNKTLTKKHVSSGWLYTTSWWNRRVLATLLNVISEEVSFWWAHKYIFSVCSRKAYWFLFIYF